MNTGAIRILSKIHGYVAIYRVLTIIHFVEHFTDIKIGHIELLLVLLYSTTSKNTHTGMVTLNISSRDREGEYFVFFAHKHLYTLITHSTTPTHVYIYIYTYRNDIMYFVFT